MNQTCWKSPSNIAIIKYWGKYGRQLPKNASLSFTLSAAYSQTTLRYSPKAKGGIQLRFLFEGQEKPAFAQRIQGFLESILEELPFLDEYALELDSKNSFPHSAGIASSASSMSALALCLCDMAAELGLGPTSDQAEFWQKASYFARLGSGSACRSLYPMAASWGESKQLKGSSNLWASPCGELLHDDFKAVQDTILLVSRAEKSVSSTAGHKLMEGNPFAPLRYQLAEENLGKLLPALQAGDWATFGQIAEEEALMLHALMMTSRPSYLLMQPNSLALIEKVRDWRQQTKLPLYFTLDAGPNLHLLYPKSIQPKVQPFLQEELLPLCENGGHLADELGCGPEKLRLL